MMFQTSNISFFIITLLQEQQEEGAKLDHQISDKLQRI